MQLQKAYAAEGFQVMMITIDKDAAEVAKAKAMAKELGADFPLLNDRFGIVARRYGVESLPMSFLIDQAGMVKMTNDGFGEDGAVKLLTQSRMALGLPLGAPAPEPLWPFVGVPPEVQAERDALKRAAAKRRPEKSGINGARTNRVRSVDEEQSVAHTGFSPGVYFYQLQKDRRFCFTAAVVKQPRRSPEAFKLSR